jgi:hypothetical protein
LWEKLKNAKNPHDLEALKWNIHEAVYNRNMSCDKQKEVSTVLISAFD